MSNTSRTSSEASLVMSSTDENWLPRPELHTYKDMCTSTTNANAKRSRGCFLVRAWTWLTARRNKTVTTAQRMETSSNSEICQLTLTQQERGGAANAARYANAVELARKGETWTRLESDPQMFLVHGPRLESLYAPEARPLEGDLQHEWWVGPSGTGKSRLLWELYPKHFAKALSKWWDGYRFKRSSLSKSGRQKTT